MSKLERPSKPPTFQIEGARILFPNFTGRESAMNAPGDRNFCVVLDPEDAAAMDAAGWNIKSLPGREEGDPDTFFTNVRVSFKYKPPMIVMLSSHGRQRLTEEMVDVLDIVEMRNVDLICNGSYWDVQGKQGFKAYLKTMFVTLEEDDLERKYGVEGGE